MFEDLEELEPHKGDGKKEEDEKDEIEDKKEEKGEKDEELIKDMDENDEALFPTSW